MLKAMLAAVAMTGLFVLAGPGQAEIRYTISDLGSIAGFEPPVQPMALNAEGLVIGTVGFSNQRSLLFAAGGMTELVGPGGVSALVTAINDDGLAVGFFPGSLSGVSQAATWTNGIVAPLALPAGAGSTAAVAVNQHGVVVGYGSFATTGQQAILWDANGQPTVLGTPGDFAGAAARAIDDNGVVTGTALKAGSGGFFSEAHIVRWTNGQFADLGAVDCTMRGANAAGQVLCNGAGPGGLQPFVYSSGISDFLGIPLGASGAAAQGINDSGEVVGTAFMAGSQAVLWQNGIPTDLNTLIDSLSGWSLTSAGAINNDGQIAVWARDAQNDVHALLLSPVPVPEPTAAALLALGLSLAVFVVRRPRPGRAGS